MSRRRDPEATRARILAAAERSFAQNGFAGTSSSDVAQGAGVTKSLIHHHFGSMRGLWEAVQAAAQVGLAELDTPLHGEAWHSTDHVVDALSATVQLVVRHHALHPRAARLRSWGEMDGENTPLRLSHVALARLGDAQARGFLRSDVDPANVMHGLFATIDAWFRRTSDLPPQPTRNETFVRDVLRVAIAGMLPSEPVAA